MAHGVGVPLDHCTAELFISFDCPVCCTDSRLSECVYILRASMVPAVD